MFREATELKPKDAVLASLVATLSPRDAQPSKPSTTTAPKPISADKIVGAWNAAGSRSASYSMTLSKDGAFTWSFKTRN